MKLQVLLFLCAISFFPLFAKGTMDAPENKRVEEILSRLSIDEKLAQISGVRPNELMENGVLSIERCKKLIPYGIGQVCQYSSSVEFTPEQLRDFVRELQSYLINNSTAKIPAIFHEEAITGFATWGATTFPQQIGMGCTWNPQLIEQNMQSVSHIMRQAGCTEALSPMMDICNNPYWGRLEESYGEEPYLVSSLGLAFTKGLQGKNLRTGVAATTKHFAGYGGDVFDERKFYEETLMPHEVLIKEGNVQNVMVGYHELKGVPCQADPWLLTDVLRKYLGFKGATVSDYGAITGIQGYKMAKSLKEAAVLALKAGNDVELPEYKNNRLLKEALEEGLITLEEIDRAVKNALLVKARLGLLDKNPQIGQDGDLDFDNAEQRHLAYQSACESVVLLKNDGKLPLGKDVKKIALVGPNANSIQPLLGDYTYQSMTAFWWGYSVVKTSPKMVTLYDGLNERLPHNVALTCERGCDWSDPKEATLDRKGDPRIMQVEKREVEHLPYPDWNNAMKLAKESDVIIAAMGENIYLSGECRSRDNIKLPGDQELFIKELSELGKPIILVIFSGRPSALGEIANKCDAIIQAWFPGEEGGNALADIIMGKVNPSGKLCVSFPQKDQNKAISHRFGYKEGNRPLYPFGYGLSYTQYQYSDFKISENNKLTDKQITISCKVTNIGECDGAEIVQLYVSSPEKNRTKETIQELKGFCKVHLKKGESKTVTFKMPPQLLAYYDNGIWNMSPGQYHLKIGSSSTDIKYDKAVNISGDQQVFPKRDIFFSKVIIK